MDTQIDIKTVRELHQKGIIDDATFSAAVHTIRPTSEWCQWAKNMLLLVGATLVLAGIIFFFAYNWQEMGKFLKLGLIQTAIIGCIIGAHLKSDRLSGNVLLLCAAILVGVLLAVYGQIYQTGADPFELFTGWATLILGWVIVSRFAALWIVWLVLIHIGAILFWIQLGDPAYHIPYPHLCAGLAALNLAALALREIGVLYAQEWLNGRWLRGILLLGILTSLSIPTLHLIVDFGGHHNISGTYALIWIAIAGLGFFIYRFKLKDILPIALIATNSCILFLFVIGKILFHERHFDEAAMFLFFAIIILIVVSGVAVWLRNTAKAMNAEERRMA